MKIDKTIKSPEGVSLLMENMWLRHRAGMQQRPCNVFMVELPPLTEVEKAALRSEKQEKSIDEDSEEFYCAFI